MSVRRLYTLLPDAEALLALEPEELAGYILLHLNSLPTNGTESGLLNRYNYTLPSQFSDYPSEYQRQVAEAVIEAWVWLEREGLLAPEPGDTGNWVFITRRGQQLKLPEGVNVYRKSNLLPKGQLHPTIAQKVWSTFLRGDYDTAIFQAFKEVEVAVRIAGGFPETVFGTELMRKAFNVDNGPLTDQTAPPAERQALSDLFAGAIGTYKNPHSHRNVALTAEEASEMIIVASHLLRIVDTRSE